MITSGAGRTGPGQPRQCSQRVEGPPNAPGPVPSPAGRWRRSRCWTRRPCGAGAPGPWRRWRPPGRRSTGSTSTRCRTALAARTCCSRCGWPTQRWTDRPATWPRRSARWRAGRCSAPAAPSSSRSCAAWPSRPAEPTGRRWRGAGPGGGLAWGRWPSGRGRAVGGPRGGQAAGGAGDSPRWPGRRRRAPPTRWTAPRPAAGAGQARRGRRQRPAACACCWALATVVARRPVPLPRPAHPPEMVRETGRTRGYEVRYLLDTWTLAAGPSWPSWATRWSSSAPRGTGPCTCTSTTSAARSRPASSSRPYRITVTRFADEPPARREGTASSRSRPAPAGCSRPRVLLADGTEDAVLAAVQPPAPAPPAAGPSDRARGRRHPGQDAGVEVAVVPTRSRCRAAAVAVHDEAAGSVTT